ncbi:O-antigen ligase family protein [Akkermansiaceae bacterium]|nr:O-antigen ligase family protein [Akkermansiaceae bacterium]
MIPMGRLLKIRLFRESLIIAVPALFTVAASNFTTAAYLFWAIFAVFFIRDLLTSNHYSIIFKILTNALLFMIFRQFVFFNILTMLLLVILSAEILLYSKRERYFRKTNHIYLVAVIIFSVYYLLTFYSTKSYAVNFRIFEFLLVALAIRVIIRRPRGLKIFAITFATIMTCYCLTILPYALQYGRLGGVTSQEAIGTSSFGNPIQIGLSMNIIWFLLPREDLKIGKRVLLSKSLLMVIKMLAFLFLVMSVSRIGWLIFSVGNLILVCKSQLKIGWVVVFTCILTAGLIVLSSTQYVDVVDAGINRTFGDERTLTQKTSGRSEQWGLAVDVFERNPEKLWSGFGAGKGSMIFGKYANYFGIYQGNLDTHWHSLLLQVVVETGLIGGCIVVFWLLWIVIHSSNLILRGKSGASIFLISYVLIVFTTSGFDMLSGMFLGIGLFINE